MFNFFFLIKGAFKNIYKAPWRKNPLDFDDSVPNIPAISFTSDF